MTNVEQNLRRILIPVDRSIRRDKTVLSRRVALASWITPNVFRQRPTVADSILNGETFRKIRTLSQLWSGRARGQRRRRHHENIICPYICGSVVISFVSRPSTPARRSTPTPPPAATSLSLSYHSFRRALVNSRTCMGRCWQANERLTLSAPITSPPPPGTLAKYCDDRWSVCLCVCLSASISLELRARSSLNILCMILLYCPRHGPPLVALRYVMYFWFYR